MSDIWMLVLPFAYLGCALVFLSREKELTEIVKGLCESGGLNYKPILIIMSLCWPLVLLFEVMKGFWDGSLLEGEWLFTSGEKKEEKGGRK